MLTDKQRAVLGVIRDHSQAHGYPPTVREIGHALGLASSSTVHSHLAALERAGYLVKDPAKPRALRLAGEAQDEARRDDRHFSASGADVPAGSGVSLPLVGQVAAGAPLLAEEHLETWMSIPRELTRSGDSFLLRVRGDSMVNVGILDGDVVVVRRQPDAANGQVVIALVDDEATCKRFHRRNGKVELHPENDEMEPMLFDDVAVLGIVTGVLRSM